jgi:hypothetical protein
MPSTKPPWGGFFYLAVKFKSVQSSRTDLRDERSNGGNGARELQRAIRAQHILNRE